MGINPVGTYQQPNFETQTGSPYKTALDNAIRAGMRFAANLAPHEAAVPDMTVVIDAGFLQLRNDAPTEVAQQTTAAFTAPTTNPRIDRIVTDVLGNDVNLIILQGVEAASPVPPTLTSFQIPICQVALAVSQTSITNQNITDERALQNLRAIQDVTTGAGVVDWVRYARDGGAGVIGGAIGRLKFSGRSSVDGPIDYAACRIVIDDPIAASAKGRFVVQTAVANSLDDRWHFTDGAYANGLADPGPGKININDLWIAGTSLFARPNVWTGTAEFDSTVQVDDTLTVNAQTNMNGVVLEQGVAPGRGSIDGLAISNNATDPTNDIDLELGVARDDTNSRWMENTTAGLRKLIDVAWAVGNNGGGLDTGTVADGWYDVYQIMRSDTGVVDMIFTLAGSGPTMPTNYDLKRLIGSVFRAGGVNKFFTQEVDGRFLWDTVVMDVNAVAKTTTAALHTLTTPSGIPTRAIISVTPVQQVLDTITQWGLVTSPLVADVVPTSSLWNLVAVRSINNFSNTTGYSGELETDTSSRIRTRFTTTSGHVNVLTMGFVHPRGRDA